MFDPNAETQLIRPNVGVDDAIRVAREVFGLDADAKELGSNQDRNFLLTPTEGDARFLLKFDNDAFDTAEIEAQNTGLLRLAERGLSVPAPVAAPDGAYLSDTTDAAGRPTSVRLLSFVEGESLVDEGHLFAGTIAGLGRLAGRVVAELADLEDPALDRDLQWDLRNAMAVVEGLAASVQDPDRRRLTVDTARAAWAHVERFAAGLPVQPVHGDITDDNVVGPRDALGRVVPESIIDFGDLSYGWRVAEVAVTVSSVLHHQPGRPLDAMVAIRAFHEVVPLEDAEIRALWPLVVLRGAVLVASGEHQVALEAENDYARERMAHEWRLFMEAASLSFAHAEAAIRAAIGEPEPSPTGDVPDASLPWYLVPALHTVGFEHVRLDAQSPLLHRGVWLDPAIEANLAGAITASGRFAIFAYGEHRLTRSIDAGDTEPVNAALVTEVWVPTTGATIAAPFDGVASIGPDRGIVVESARGTVTIAGAVLEVGGPVAAGAYLGHATAGSRLSISWRRPGVVEAPAFTNATHLPMWRRLTADPAALLGVPAADWLADPTRERARRAEAVADAAERYYEVPPEIERGWRDLLIDTTGRPYVDMVNNVSGIGHGHPRLADAIHEQYLTLNTNSRFLYRALADYVERLVELAPDPSLSTVFLVNSGSEAVDLAIRLAQVHTGRQDVLALREGYHGWTFLTDAVSTSAFDNPGALDSRPEWVHLVEAVNTYRGPHRDDDAAERYAADLEWKLGELEAMGRTPGAFLCEPVFGNGGGIVYPDGYLAAAYEAVRARGGLCISDEVQVGLGRLGHYTWGCQQQRVVPDILAVAKALGNGYPLGAVYTTSEIAASLSREGMFFSSAGGAIASAAAGLAVLDVMRDEHLQANAARVGDHVRRRLESLMDRQPLIGAYHGIGLYGGVELVRDRDSREPAVEETAWVCERLLDYGVIMQSTSERRNVLKVKPPLVLSRAHADLFVDALDAVLSELASGEQSPDVRE